MMENESSSRESINQMNGSGSNDHNNAQDNQIYKMSKKIAQLTRVIYSLNTRNDDLEKELQEIRTSLPSGITPISKQSATLQCSKLPINGEIEWLQQVKDLKRERSRLKISIDEFEVKIADLTIERDLAQRDVKELTKSNSDLQLALATARIQLSYSNRQGGNEEIEALRRGKIQLETTLLDSRQFFENEKYRFQQSLKELSEVKTSLEVRLSELVKLSTNQQEQIRMLTTELDAAKLNTSNLELALSQLKAETDTNLTMAQAETLRLLEEGKRNSVQLEKAMEEALLEREEILQAATLEIEHERNVALQMEQKLMDDFEWKLREIEGDNRTKVRELEASIETKMAVETADYRRKKDEELTQLCIKARRDMEERFRAERTSLSESFQAKSIADEEKRKISNKKEIQKIEKSFDAERDAFRREIKRLQDSREELSRVVRAEYEGILFEERRKASRIQTTNQEEYEKMEDSLNGKIIRLKAEIADMKESHADYINQAEADKSSSVFDMKEQVEIEFNEKMERLRDMYQAELTRLMNKVEESDKKVSDLAHQQQVSSLEEKTREIEELNAYCAQQADESERKINSLLERLQEQIERSDKLQKELDEYEWYEEDEEEDTARRQTHNETPDKADTVVPLADANPPKRNSWHHEEPCQTVASKRSPNSKKSQCTHQ